MNVLFLDDSYRQKENYLGHGGFCIHESEIGQLSGDILALKEKFGIPRWVELKWSPSPKHYLNTKFRGDRQQLWREAIRILNDHNATIICAVHDLNNCYGVTLYDWDFERTRLWATKEQLKFIAERFERPYLSTCVEYGLVIADHYGSFKGQTSIIEQVSYDILGGTRYRQFEKLCMLPVTTVSRYCPLLQMADIVVGIVVASLANSSYGLNLFEDVAKLFLRDPHEDVTYSPSTFSDAVLGFGLTLFPPSFRVKGLELFEQTALDYKYICTSKGLEQRTFQGTEV